MIDVDKFAKEPLVWVAAAALCIPMLGSGFLTKLKGLVVFESGSQPAVAIADPEPIELAKTSPLPPIRSNAEAAETPATSNLNSNYPSTSVDSFATRSDAATMSLGAKANTSVEPDSNVEFDPGSLAFEFDEDEEGRIRKPGDFVSTQESDQDDEEFDFLFGDDPEPAAKEAQANPGSTAKSPQEPQSTGPRDGLRGETKPPKWLFPEKEIAESKTESNLPFNMPAQDSTDGNAPGQPVASLKPQRFEPAAPDKSFAEIPPATRSQNEIYFELEPGFDWWTPHCQQAITGKPARHAGLDAVVFAAMQNSPVVKLINTEPEIAQTIVSESNAEFDWSTFVDVSWGDTDRAVVSLLDTGTAGGRFVQQQLLFEAGVKRNLRGGGQLRVGNAFQRTDNNSSFLSPPDQGTSQLILDYRQPLMRGAGKHINASQIMLAQIGADAANQDSRVKLQQFLVDVVGQYWELYFARSVLVQRMKSLNRAKTLLHDISRQVGADDATQRALIRIKAVMAARETDVIRAQNQVAIHQETLINLTHGATTEDFSQIEIIPTETPGAFLVPYDLDFVTEVAVQNRAEVQVALAAIRAAAVAKDLALNDLKPQLDAVISTFVSGVAEDKQVGDAFTDSFNNDPSYAVGFSFEVPIGRRASRSRLQRQQLEYQRLQYQLEQTLGNIRLDARLAYRNVQSLASELDNDKAAAGHAAQELEFVTEKSGQQRVSSNPALANLLVDDVLQSQARMALAEERLLRSQTDLSIALVELKRATGQLLRATPMTTQKSTVRQASWNEPVGESAIEDAPRPTLSNSADHSAPSTTNDWQPPQQNRGVPELEFQHPLVESGRYDLSISSIEHSAHPLSNRSGFAPPRQARRLPGKRR